jgi:cytochrome c biogenesis protein
VLAAAGRLSHLSGHLEVAEGEEFSGELSEYEAGPLHPFGRLKAQRFSNLGFHIAYAPGLSRVGTRNTVSYLNAFGIEERLEIGDHKPLVLDGYRFYTTHNKGFAPVFEWRSGGSALPMLGAVNLPSYPINDLRQSREWLLPGTDIRAWVQLQFDEVILDPAKPSEFRLPNKHTLVLRIGDGRWELQPGGHVDLAQGRLTYQGLRTWMGYTVFYDWTITWMLVACLVALAAMAWHFKVKFSARPWNE